MRELLRAQWYRIRKSGLFLWLSFCILAISIVSILPYLMDELYMEYAMKNEADTSNILAFALLAGAACAVLCGHTEETGYTEGILRNMFIAGHTRSQVYWTSLIAGTLCGIIFSLLYLVPELVFQFIFTQPVRDPAAFWASLSAGLLTVPAFVSLYVTIGAAVGRKGIGLTCMVVYALLVMIALIFMEQLGAPEYIQSYTAGADGQVIEANMLPNPSYIRPPARYVLDFVFKFLPSGAAVLTTAMQSGTIWLYPLGFTAVSSAAGLVILNRRNIR